MGIKYSYIPADEVLVLNQNDPDLFPIRINILDLIKRTYRQYGFSEPMAFPSFSKMENYGMDPHDQVFVRDETPQSLVSLERSIRNEQKKIKRNTAIRIELDTINRFWDILK
jgi:hypothetical protein